MKTEGNMLESSARIIAAGTHDGHLEIEFTPIQKAHSKSRVELKPNERASWV